jgi:phosphoribosyl 1,2-cyclic phosphate phosphodiesterase
MKITFLGTGTSQGVPVVACHCEVCSSGNFRDKRLRSSLLLEDQGKFFVIDAGPDFRQQMLREGVDHLESILLTHEHKDHIGGLDDVRAFNYFQKKAMDVYARREIHSRIMTEFDYAFKEDKYPGVPEICLHAVGDQAFQVSHLEILPVTAEHYKLPVLGFRIGDFVYLTDFSTIREEEKQKLLGAKIVILPALRKKPHYSHMNLEQALQLIEEIRPEKAYLTHISHMMGLHDTVEKELPANVKLAYDGLKLEIHD